MKNIREWILLLRKEHDNLCLLTNVQIPDYSTPSRVFTDEEIDEACLWNAWQINYPNTTPLKLYV